MPAITVAFISYFGYHSVHGSYGLKATEALEAQRIQRVQELEALTHERIKLEKQVQLLSDGSMERDMLDEQARAALNISKPDEIVIFH
jgi:cell division protein FtsB